MLTESLHSMCFGSSSFVTLLPCKFYFWCRIHKAHAVTWYTPWLNYLIIGQRTMHSSCWPEFTSRLTSHFQLIIMSCYVDSICSITHLAYLCSQKLDWRDGVDHLVHLRAELFPTLMYSRTGYFDCPLKEKSKQNQQKTPTHKQKKKPQNILSWSVKCL